MPDEQDQQLASRVAALLAARGEPGTVEDLHRLSGGASRDTWAFDLVGAHRRPMILQRGRPGTVSGGPDMPGEAALLRLAGGAGVPVPAVVAEDAGAALGAPCLVTERLTGETIARKVLRDAGFATARSRIVAQAGAALARIHSIDAEEAPPLRDADQLDEMRMLLHGLDEPHPALELGIRWLAANRPTAPRRAVVHGDFRLGNLVVDEQGLAGVLDWELAHLGDPAEDLGWFCVRAWRFGSPLPAGGLGTREDLLAAYSEAGGTPVGVASLRWWELLGTVKWGLICIVQSLAHLSGASRSVELAAIGRRVCENEWDVLGLLPGTSLPVPAATPRVGPPTLHGRPTATELIQAVREWIERDVRTATEGRVAFHARVAANALGVVERELAMGAAQEAAHAERLAALGFGDEHELATAIRSGVLDDRLDEVRAAIAATVAAKLAVANPGWLDDD